MDETRTRPSPDDAVAAAPPDAPPEFSVVVPCYNEEGAVLDTVASLTRHLADAGPYELIFVDDGSQDRTGELLEDAVRDHPSLRVVRLKRNAGYGAAIKSGIRRARSGLIAITDADGTYPLDRLVELVDVCRKDGADMAVGSRTGENVQYSKLRKVPKIFLRRYAQWIAGQPIPDMNSGMRVFRKDIAEQYLKILPDGFSLTTTITLAMMRGRFDVRFVPISYTTRVGQSKIRPIHDTLKFFQLILRTGVYFSPLRVFAPVILVMGAAFLASLAYDVFYLVDLTEKTLILLLFTLNFGIFALLADMVDKRSA